MSSRQPHGQHHHGGEDGGGNHSVEGADLVGVEAGQPASYDRADVQNDESLIREGLLETLVESIGTDVCERHE